jgi:hypothetical protein
LLQEIEQPQAKLALQHYKFWQGFERLKALPYGHVTEFANRKVIEFDPEIGITETVGTAYALRVRRHWSQVKPDMNIAGKLQLFLYDPRASQIEALVFGNWITQEYISSQPVVDALIDAELFLPNLKALFIGDIEDPEMMISSIVQTDLSLVLVAYPDLEVLKIRGDSEYWGGGQALAFQPLRHDRLKALIVESGGLHREAIAQICQLELPALEYLELWLGSEHYGGTSAINDIMPILSDNLFPKLKYLGLRNSEYTDDIAFAIVNSPILEQLLDLDLSMGNLGDEGAAALLNCSAIAQLDTLNVADNCLTPEMAMRLMQLDIEVNVNRMKSSHSRYCSVAE